MRESGGEALSERFVVLTMSGLESFGVEAANIVIEEVDGIPLPVLSLERIAHSKRAAGRVKDRLALESIEDVLACAPRRSRRADVRRTPRPCQGTLHVTMTRPFIAMHMQPFDG